MIIAEAGHIAALDIIENIKTMHVTALSIDRLKYVIIVDVKYVVATNVTNVKKKY